MRVNGWINGYLYSLQYPVGAYWRSGWGVLMTEDIWQPFEAVEH